MIEPPRRRQGKKAGRPRKPRAALKLEKVLVADQSPGKTVFWEWPLLATKQPEAASPRQIKALSMIVAIEGLDSIRK